MKFSKEMLENLPRKNTPVSNWMAELYEKTASDGTLRLLNPYEYATTSVLTCQMNWDISAFEKITAEFNCLRDALQAIAPHWDALHAEGADAAAILQDEVLLQVYRTFFAPLHTGDFDRIALGILNSVATICVLLRICRRISPMVRSTSRKF